MNLVKVRDSDGAEFAADENYIEDGWEVVGGSETLTAEQIAHELAMDAEAGNYHDFVLFIEALAPIVTAAGGEEVARKVMLEIAKRGGYEMGN